jgi:hypothetical protein
VGGNGKLLNTQDGSRSYRRGGGIRGGWTDWKGAALLGIKFHSLWMSRGSLQGASIIQWVGKRGEMQKVGRRRQLPVSRTVISTLVGSPRRTTATRRARAAAIRGTRMTTTTTTTTVGVRFGLIGTAARRRRSTRVSIRIVVASTRRGILIGGTARTTARRRSAISVIVVARRRRSAAAVVVATRRVSARRTTAAAVVIVLWRTRRIATTSTVRGRRARTTIALASSSRALLLWLQKGEIGADSGPGMGPRTSATQVTVCALNSVWSSLSTAVRRSAIVSYSTKPRPSRSRLTSE